MRRWLLPIILCFPFAAFAENISVPFHKTTTLLVPGATAAYAINGDVVGASATGGVVTLVGKSPGSTNVIVVTPSGVQSIVVVVPIPPPTYPPGFRPPPAAGQATELGSYEVRLVTNPGQLQNNFDFLERQGDRTTHFFLGNANFFSTQPGVSTVSFPLAYYQISTPRRAITLFDQFASVSPLTLDDTLVRGVHGRYGPWFVHAGYTSLAVFDQLFLPTGRQAVFGGGYHYALNDHETLTPSLFYFGDEGSGVGAAQPGIVGSLRFEDKLSDQLRYAGELGIGRGVGASGQVDYITQQDNLTAMFHFEPKRFADLVTQNYHGLYSNADGFHRFSDQVRLDYFLSGDHYVFSNFNQGNFTSGLTVNDQINPQWGVLAGWSYSEFSTSVPPSSSSTPSNLTSSSARIMDFPVGLTYTASHWADSFLYQHSINHSVGNQQVGNPGGNELRDSGHYSWRHFQVGGYIDRLTQTPSVSLVAAQTSAQSPAPGLQLALDQLTVTTTTPQQIARLLRSDATLVSLGAVQSASVALNPAWNQYEGDFRWAPPGPHEQEVNVEFLASNLQTATQNVKSLVQSATYSRQLDSSNSIFASYSLFRTTTPGSAGSFQSQVEVSFRHQFYYVPRFIIPSRHGAITGVVFEDDKGVGAFHHGMKGLAGVEVSLDGVAQTRTDSSGLYAFRHVPYGLHTVEAHFHSSRAFFFTTPSQATVDTNSTVDFGVGYSLAQIFGSVLSDAGEGIAGVTVQLSGPSGVRSKITDMDGEFAFKALAPGKYTLIPNADSFPPGYAVSDLKPQTVLAASTSAGNVTFRVTAYRSIAGHVRVYDRSLLRQVPVPGISVELLGTPYKNKTDSTGAYIFRNLPKGNYTVGTEFLGREFKQTVRLQAAPSFPRKANLDVGAVDKFSPAMVEAAPTQPAPPAKPKAATPKPRAARSQPHDALVPKPRARAPSALDRAPLHDHLRDVFFNFNRWNLRPDARAALHANAKFLSDDPMIFVLIEGYCDDRGTVAVNQTIGEFRAMAAKDFLVEHGVAANRIETVSLGKTRPFCKEHTPQCRQLNRRAHFVLDDQK